ncbi:hypothetical protein ACFYQA_19995 [Streptomyces sp. NPDC005774]|uniref:hypothetical protein n=1 Tax=Streptomyces TaxID=1883 RepID=UPI00368BC690
MLCLLGASCGFFEALFVGDGLFVLCVDRAERKAEIAAHVGRGACHARQVRGTLSDRIADLTAGATLVGGKIEYDLGSQ